MTSSSSSNSSCIRSPSSSESTCRIQPACTSTRSPGLHLHQSRLRCHLISLKIHHSLIFLYRQHPSGQSNTHTFPLTAHRTGSRPSDSLSFLQPPTSESLLFLRQLKRGSGRFHCRQIIFYYTRFQPIFQPFQRRFPAPAVPGRSIFSPGFS